MSVTEIRRIPAAETRGIRQAVLRPNQPVEAVIYPGDDDTDTLHLGLYEQHRLVGVASIYREPPPGELRNIRAWRLRGMAVERGRQGQGHGAALLRACLEHAAQQGGSQVWCNARTVAAGFYRSLGFALKGDAFELPGTGPHYFMWRPLESAR